MSEGPASVDGVSAGTLLRQAREAAGLHVATLAANLKVPVRKLEALEQDRYDLLPDAVFVRALASSVCRTLKMDPQPVLERLPQTAQPRLVGDGEMGLNAPFRAPSDGPGPSVLDQITRPVVLTVVALLLGALVLIFLPIAQKDDAGQVARNDAVMPPSAPATITVPPSDVPPNGLPAAPAPAVASANPPVSLTPASSVAPGASRAPASAAVSTAAVAPTAPRAAASAAPAASAPQAAASGPIAARGIIAFRTRGPSWIEVTDATGATVFRKLMEPGESAGASGTLPLAVTVGSVQATEVEVRGKPYNLAPVSKDNVARFEIK